MKFFRNIYFVIFRWYTLLLIKMASSAVRKLMLLLNKNPDYVPPPVSKPIHQNFDDLDINRAWMVDTKERSRGWLAVIGDDQFYVRNAKEHPLLRVRAQWEEKQRQSKLPPQVSESNVEATAPSEVAVSDSKDTKSE